jgi:hypothetical protein
MRRNGWQRVRRQKSVPTTISDPAAEPAPDLVDRQFRVPTQTSSPTLPTSSSSPWCSSTLRSSSMPAPGPIIGWQAASVKQTRFAESAIRQAAALRTPSMLPPSLVVVPSTAPPSLRRCVDRLNLVHTLQYISVRRCLCRGCGPRSAASGMPTTTHWPWAPQERVHPRRFTVPARPAAQPRRRRAHHRRLRQLIQPAASCTAWDASHQPKQKPNTTINWTPANRPAHRTPRVHETRDGSVTYRHLSAKWHNSLACPTVNKRLVRTVTGRDLRNSGREVLRRVELGERIVRRDLTS